MNHGDITEKSPRSVGWYINAGTIIILAFFGGFGSWAALGKMEGAIIAPGIIKVEKNRKEIQHLEGGIVQNIWVKNGDRVTKGQKLVTLKNTTVRSNVDMLKGQRYVALAHKARLESERDLKEKIDWPHELLAKRHDPVIKEIMDATNEIFLSQRESLKGQTTLLKTQIQQILQQVGGLKKQALAIKSVIEALKEELVAKRELLEERFLDKPAVLALERELADRQGDQSSIDGQIAQNMERITEIRVRINDLKTKYVERAVNQLSQNQATLFDLEDRLRPLVDAQTRLDITAPSAGVVVDMQVFSPGSVVKPGEVLMQIVPEDEPLIIECSVRPVDIAKVHVDQDARIQLNAFNRNEVDPVDGKVIYVAADTVFERTPYGEQYVYRVNITLDRNQVAKQDITLSPGMPTTVFLNTGERTFLNYISEPLIENFRRALKE